MGAVLERGAFDDEGEEAGPKLVNSVMRDGGGMMVRSMSLSTSLKSSVNAGIGSTDCSLFSLATRRFCHQRRPMSSDSSTRMPAAILNVRYKINFS